MSAFDYCKWGAAESVFINLRFQYFFCADLVVLQNRVHNTKEEVNLNNKKKEIWHHVTVFLSSLPIITYLLTAHTPLVIFSLIDMLV